jgi:tetratricopeptide (TPR) repeat protein
MSSISCRRESGVTSQTSRLELLADFYESQGKYAEAEQICRRIVEVKESIYGYDSVEIAPDLHNLGLLCYAQDNYEQAEQYLTRCLTMEESALGLDAIELASTLDVLAQLFYEQGKYAQAVDACKRAIDICDRGNLKVSTGVYLTFADAAEYLPDFDGSFTRASGKVRIGSLTPLQ